jgi:hypothetical protein
MPVTTYPDALYNPLGAPSLSGTVESVDFMLNNPTRVTRTVNDLTLANNFATKVFNIGGDVSGGAVLYDQANILDTYAARDVERIAPGAEAPIIDGVRKAPLVAVVEKFGGKFAITKEARDRNDITRFNNQVRRLSNTIARKMEQRALAELEANISTYSQSGSGLSWSDAMGLTFDTTAKNLLPAYDFSAIVEANEGNEMGYRFDTLIINQAEAHALRTIYGGDLDEVLRDFGITQLISTPRMTAGTAYVLESGTVGQVRLEEPLRTTITDESTSAPTLVEQTWVQTLINPVFLVTDPFAVFKLTGLEA